VLGRITDLAADAGDTVISGMTLVSLDSSDLHAQRLQSLATIHAMEANVAVAKVSIERAEEDFLRAQQQFTDKVIPKEVYDHAQKELQTAKVRCSAAEAQVVTAKSQLGIIAAQLLNLTVAAPIDGIVAKRWVMAGEVVQPGQPIYTLYDTKSQWITASFEETKLRTLHLGDVVQISVDAYPHVAFTGKVIQFGTNTAAQFSLIPPNNAAGNFTKITQRVPVKIAINPTGNPDTRLLPGMSVEVRVKVR